MTTNLTTVALNGLPLDVHKRAEEHNLTLKRELALVHVADQSGSAPARLLWLSQQLSGKYDAFNTEPRTTLQEAVEGQRPTIDLQFEVPVDAADAAEELGRVLAEVDDYCRSGDLLTLVAPPETQAYRNWFLGEFIAQIRDGAGPSSWTSAVVAPEPGTTDQNKVNPGRHKATIAIDDDLDLEGAAGRRGEIAELLDRGVIHLTVDLAGCEFIDSVGISLLLTTRARLQHSGGTLVVTNVEGASRRTLEISGVYDVLTSGS